MTALALAAGRLSGGFGLAGGAAAGSAPLPRLSRGFRSRARGAPHSTWLARPTARIAWGRTVSLCCSTATSGSTTTRPCGGRRGRAGGAAVRLRRGDARRRGFAAPNRVAFMLDALRDLDEALRRRARRLFVRRGDPVREAMRLAQECGAGEIHVSADWSAYARRRERRLAARLRGGADRLPRPPRRDDRPARRR